ncbi:MAG: hypothetical protein KKH47_13105, partial [Proteobacteria bacterium]|nr:hypothetical protein [Pseudomonadota bacterium]
PPAAAPGYWKPSVAATPRRPSSTGETELIITTGFLYGQLLYGASIPVVDQLDQDPLAVIATGDLVRVDGAAGIVEIFKP